MSMPNGPIPQGSPAVNPNPTSNPGCSPYSTAPQYQQGGQYQQYPQAPQFQQTTYAPVVHGNMRTQRGLLKYMLLGFITLGIYDIWQLSEVTTSLNLIAYRRDGKRTMHYCLVLFVFSWLTLGIAYLVWGHRLSERIGEEQNVRGMRVTLTATDFWLWNILGILIIVGPFVYTYKLLHAMNDICADYNMRG